MKLDLKFLTKKILSSGTPRAKGQPIYAIFAKGTEGIIKSMHEDIEDAKGNLSFGDVIVKYGAHSKIELQYTETQL